MPVNRNALIRYKTIDNCLRNKYKKWTLEDLIEACSEALYEYEGIDKGVSRRTIQMDIQIMRSEKLGYNAPIAVVDRKYYCYKDLDYSITNIPLTRQDLGKLSEVVGILRQFKGFTHFQDLSTMVQKLEDKIQVSETKERAVIDLEKNENLKGLEFIDPVFQAIIRKRCIHISYHSFKARKADSFLFHPALLKEYRNRWFMLGKKHKDLSYTLLALDRLHALQPTDQPILDFDEAKISGYFEHVVGVSVNQQQEPQEVKLLVDHSNAPYVLTKPIHHSQKLVEKNDQGVIISLLVQLNFELEREILGFGDSIMVLSPPRLRERIKEKLSHALDLYNTQLNKNDIKSFGKRLKSRGFVILNSVYTRKEIRKIGILLDQYNKSRTSENGTLFTIRNLWDEIPALKEIILNSNLTKILHSIDSRLTLSGAVYFNTLSEDDRYQNWHQDLSIDVKQKIATDGFCDWTTTSHGISVCPPEDILQNTVTIRLHLDDATRKNGALQVLAGSHHARFNDTEVSAITKNSVPAACEVRAGGIQIMKPLLLRAYPAATNNKKGRVIHLRFNSLALPNGLQWA